MARSPAISPSDVAEFTASIRRFAPVPDPDIRQMLDRARVRTLERGEHFLRSGQVAHEVAVVMFGLLREYFLMADGVERTKSFVIEGQGSGSMADLLSGAPSRAFIVAEEPSRLLVIAYAEYRAVLERSAAWDLFARRRLENLFITKAEREYELLGMDAEARYAAFQARFPGIETRVAAKHVASYVGITPVHLSRLRNKRRQTRNGGSRKKSSQR